MCKQRHRLFERKTEPLLSFFELVKCYVAFCFQKIVMLVESHPICQKSVLKCKCVTCVCSAGLLKRSSGSTEGQGHPLTVWCVPSITHKPSVHSLPLFLSLTFKANVGEDLVFIWRGGHWLMPRRTIPISGVYRYQCSRIPERWVFSESKRQHNH